ncbi:MAG: hypothetical protein KKF44_01955 [Nanoarchaeota archaeon]|nr:hypothetical protein [Nanoarchaeota archaeon]
MSLYDGFQILYDIGVIDIILPFLLVFTIVYAVLYRSQILGEPKKPFNKMVALAIGLAVVFPHVIPNTGAPDVVPIINSALPQVSIIAVAIVMLLILIGIWGVDVNIAGKSFGGWVVIGSILIIAVIFAHSAGWLPFIPDWTLRWIGEDTMSLLIIILVFGIVISFITSEEKDEDKRVKPMDALGDILGGRK